MPPDYEANSFWTDTVLPWLTNLQGPIEESTFIKIIGSIECNAFGPPPRLFEIISFINHSCIPNVHVSDDGIVVIKILFS